MKTEGRMMRKSISNSKGFASLSPEAAVLFCMLIPNLDSYGKLNGGPGYIKDEICPRVSYLTLELLPTLLKEISDKTNIKWFDVDGRMYLHSLSFLKKHQRLSTDRIGADTLPSYSGFTLELLALEVEVEVEVEDKGYTPEFEKFWASYPSKVGKGKAFATFQKQKLGNGKLPMVLASVETWKKSKRWHDGFIKDPATWLNQKCYDDSPELVATQNKGVHV